MKTKFSLPGLCLLIIVLLSGCHKEETAPPAPSNPENAKLKQVLMYPDLASQDPLSIVEEYQYDENWRISMVSSPMYNNGTIVGTIKYDTYEYDWAGRLSKIRNYNANIYAPSGFINLKNKLFTYSPEGVKTREATEYPMGGLTEYLDFEYKNGLLNKTKKYTGNQLESYTEYSYDKYDRLIKESFYSSDDQCQTYTIHSYTGSLKTKSDFYTCRDNSQYRSWTFTYDDNNNLITLVSKELAIYSSMMGYVYRYKYYE
jgi:hypothetical protein